MGGYDMHQSARPRNSVNKLRCSEGSIARLLRSLHWLETAGDAACDIAELLADFSNISPRTFDALAKDRLKLSLFDFENEDNLEKHRLPLVPIDKWRSMVSFFDRAWFSRL
ncbi:hypothetical protein ABVK25_001125 [Lepraria finkii]|uniref:Uncharacterized protein n=1 Tax=Lepraria finkii TaxID=1340010 RepID=A0ABR4BLW3_9LECA